MTLAAGCCFKTVGQVRARSSRRAIWAVSSAATATRAPTVAEPIGVGEHQVWGGELLGAQSRLDLGGLDASTAALTATAPQTPRRSWSVDRCRPSGWGRGDAEHGERVGGQPDSVKASRAAG